MKKPTDTSYRCPLTTSLLLLVVGIVVGGELHPSLPLILLLLVPLAVAVWLFQRVAGWLLVPFIILCGMVAEYGSRSTSFAEGDEEMILKVERVTSQRNNLLYGEARVYARMTDAEWQGCNQMVRFRCDTTLRVVEGELLQGLFVVRSYDSHSANDYERKMAQQGFSGEVFCPDSSLVAQRKVSLTLPERMRHHAINHLAELPLGEDATGIAEAMTVSKTTSLTPQLREAYSRSGMAHLLAVSGLHVGFILFFAMLVLRWMVLLRRGHIWMVVANIGVVWLYALMVGLEPSILRATLMLSIYLLLSIFSHNLRPLERLSLTGMVMLCMDATTLYDIGFQLSFVAVWAITEWGVGWARLWTVKEQDLANRYAFVVWLAECARWLWSAACLALAAGIAVVPLCSYHFGIVSLWSVITSPLMIPIGGFVIGVCFLWILCPIDALSGVVGWCVDGGIGVMNALAEWSTSHAWLCAEWRMNGWLCSLLYALMAALTIRLRRR